MKRTTIGRMRQCKLPPATPDDSPVLQSLRINVESDHPDNLVLTVENAMIDLMNELTPKSTTPAAEPAPEPEPTPEPADATKPRPRHRG